MENNIEITKSIHRYIEGDLKPCEIDKLWILFLRSKEWFEFFETELLLRKLIKEGDFGLKLQF